MQPAWEAGKIREQRGPRSWWICRCVKSRYSSRSSLKTRALEAIEQGLRYPSILDDTLEMLQLLI